MADEAYSRLQEGIGVFVEFDSKITDLPTSLDTDGIDKSSRRYQRS